MELSFVQLLKVPALRDSNRDDHDGNDGDDDHDDHDDQGCAQGHATGDYTRRCTTTRMCGCVSKQPCRPDLKAHDDEISGRYFDESAL